MKRREEIYSSIQIPAKAARTSSAGSDSAGDMPVYGVNVTAPVCTEGIAPEVPVPVPAAEEAGMVARLVI